MSPRRVNPASSTPALRPAQSQQNNHPRNRIPRRPPNQPTIWQFIIPVIATPPPLPIPRPSSPNDNLNDNPNTNTSEDNVRRGTAPTNLTQSSAESSVNGPILDDHPGTPPLHNYDHAATDDDLPAHEHQRALHRDATNDGWGDLLQYATATGHFRVISKNVNTINPYSLDMVAISTELRTMNASIFCAQETNTAWTPPALQAFQHQCRTTYPYHKLAVSSSQEKNEGWFQPGGTATVALDAWANRVIGWGSNELLGRWSYLELVGQHDKRVIIASAYRVCPQEYDPTTNTSTAQQTRLLQQKGETHPNPRQQFITDLITQIKSWRQQQKEVLICMDANEDVSTPNTQISRIFHETDLVDVHQYRYPATPRPATHQRGSTPIDMMIGTQLFATATTAAWILPFGDPPLIKGDHRLLGADFHPGILFGSTPTTQDPGMLRGINSRHEQHAIQYCIHVVKQCNTHHLQERLATLLSKTSLLAHDIDELESIDQKLTKILVQADQHLRPLSSVPWSPAVQQAYLLHRYWTLTRMAKRQERNLSAAIQRVQEHLDPALIDNDPQVTLSTKLRKAQRALRKARRAAAQLRQQHMEKLLNEAIAANQTKKSNALKYLIRAERNRQCYARFRNYTKPKSAGGLAFVTIPLADGTQHPLLDRDEIEDTLLEHSRIHFAAADGSPFTREPLSRLLQYDGLTPFGEHVHSGSPPLDHYDFDEQTIAILKNLKKKFNLDDTAPHSLDYDLLMNGIKKWPEKTTTSPSGRHLGIYKTLQKHTVKKKRNATADETQTPENNAELKQGRDVLFLIFDIMTIALKHTYLLQRWRNVWTMFIEKEAGNPDINRLRCIMLFEADWQLLLKWYSSYGFLPATEHAGALANEQGGGRKGRSAIDQATQQIVETESIHLTQRPALDLYLDLKACFDMMVEACHNLACRRHGADVAYLRLHARTHQLMRYYVRHKFGVSAEFNTSEQHPWHGAGQGAADAALRYIVLSDTLIDAYHAKVAPTLMHDPTQLLAVIRSLKAFIDDVVLHAKANHDGNINDLMSTAQNNLRWWNQLVQVTGGSLNPKKCCGMLYQWEPDSKGILRLCKHDEVQHTLSLSDDTNAHPIPILPPTEGTRYLGIYLTTDRNTTPMERNLWAKTLLYTQAFQRTPMNHREAGVLYRSCFLPAITYPLPATWLPDRFFEKMHQHSTSTILNKMGYHRTLPRTLVFAPRAMGGVGLVNLQNEMEIQQILILVRHLRAATPLGKAMELLIRQYQLWAGFKEHILTDSSPCPWIPDRWLSRVRRTINTYNIKLKYDAWTIPPLRMYDVYIMEAIHELGLNTLQLEQINACRMYLQVTTLAEISDHTGSFLLTQALLQNTQTEPVGLTAISTSTLVWPEIHNPTKATWKLWTTTISTLFTGSAQGTKLRTPLGNWTTDYQKHRHWKWRMTPAKSLLYKSSMTDNTKAALLVQTQRRYLTYTLVVPTNQTFHGAPVTPHDPQLRSVRTPIPLPPTTTEEVNTTAITTLTDQFRKQLHQWQRPLYRSIKRHQKTTFLHELCTQHRVITLVSDASVQKNKQSGFAWIITHGARHLWSGIGLAPGPTEDMYSGRAEAFGVLAGLLFLRYYISCFPKETYHGAKIQCHCDNQGIITNVTAMRTNVIQRPNDTTSDDFDLYAAICQAAAQSHPVRVTFSHVKGHQDKDPQRPLATVEQLNVECDKRAKSYTKSASSQSTAYGNPQIPIAQPHLLIGNKNICRKVISALRMATAVPPYRMALQKKFQWTRGDFDNIQWSNIESALNSLLLEDQRRLILFLHDKLPLRASKAHPHRGSQMCPSCQRETEDARHFLECTHPDRTRTFHNLKNTLTEYVHKIRLHPCIFTAIWLGLVATRTQTAYPDIIDDVPQPLRLAITQQEKIGWPQLYRGRISKAWATTIDAIHPRLPATGENVMLKIIKILWAYFLDVWKIRNTHLHNTSATYDLPNYKQAVATLYEQRHQLSPRAQAALYKHPIQQILDLPLPRLQQWVIRGYRYFTQQLKAEKRQALMATPDIRNFFQPIAQHTDDLHPP